MIPSAKSSWFSAWFASQAGQRLAQSFGAVHVTGAAHLEDALRDGPVLTVSNHCAWWDSLVILWLTRSLLSADSYAMMDAANLRRLPFFAKVGAFGVDLGSRRDGAEAMRYAEGLLDRPGRHVWIFAQGQERPQHERPLRFLGGAARIAVRNPNVATIPVALTYVFGPTPWPSVFVAIGPRLPAYSTAAKTRRAQARAVEALHDQAQRELSTPGSEGFEAHPLRRSGWMETLAERALAWLTRPFVPGLRPPQRSASRRALSAAPTAVGGDQAPARADANPALAPAYPSRAEGGSGKGQ